MSGEHPRDLPEDDPRRIAYEAQLRKMVEVTERMRKRELAQHGIKDGREPSMELRAHLMAMGGSFGPESDEAVKAKYGHIIRRIRGGQP